MTRRIVCLFAGLLLCFVCSIGKLYEVSGQWYAGAAQQQSRRTAVVYRSRGTMYDRALRPLTNTGNAWRLCALPFSPAVTRLQEQGDDWLQAAQPDWQQGRPALFTADKPLTSAVGLWQFRVPVYGAYPVAAPHLLGYLLPDGTAATGLEKALDDVLSSYGGTIEITYATDGAGQILQREMPQVHSTLSRSAGGVVLTLDLPLQLAAEEICGRLLPKGAAVIADPATGQILAAVSCPSYRADRVAESLDDGDAPLFNRVMNLYNVGSVFKIVSAAAALEAGVSPQQSFACTGSVPVGSRTIRCHYRLGHGIQTMREGFLHSCNPYFVQLMQFVGPGPFAYMASALGFDKVLTPAPGYRTARAVLPTEAQWQIPGVLADLSFGQGCLLATPLHIAQLIGCVVNDGMLVRPTVVLGTVDETGVLTEQAPAAPQPVFSAETAAQLRQMMIAVVEDGTGRAGRPSVGGAGAKTGTAETGWTAADGKTMVQSWYAGFYPAQNPRYTVVVVSEDSGTTGRSAAPVFQALCDALAAR
ncbi:MAG: penicillin-binding protein 2 [Clostridia bacterium]|nr:penicillin-binding protein 2 [Clostridia bacterium]